MANVVSNAYKQYLAASWLTDNIKLVLLSSGYTYSSAHANLSDVPAGNRIATSANLSGKGNTNGVLTAANYTFTALSGANVTQCWFYKDTGTEATSTLAFYFNIAVGLVFVPVGTDLLAQFDPNGIIAL
jgi:hypothetical protein